jgi:hypothetical protein
MLVTALIPFCIIDTSSGNGGDTFEIFNDTGNDASPVNDKSQGAARSTGTSCTSLLGSKYYAAVDLEWSEKEENVRKSIFAAAFVPLAS